MTVSTWDMYDTYEQLREAQNAAAGNKYFSYTFTYMDLYTCIICMYEPCKVALRTRA